MKMPLNNRTEPLWAFGEQYSPRSETDHKQAERGRGKAWGVSGEGQGGHRAQP